MLLFILGFLNLRHSIINNIGSCTSPNFSMYLPSLQNSPLYNFFNQIVLFKKLSCLGTSHNLPNLEGKYFGQNQHKDVSDHY